MLLCSPFWPAASLLQSSRSGLTKPVLPHWADMFSRFVHVAARVDGPLFLMSEL